MLKYGYENQLSSNCFKKLKDEESPKKWVCL